MRKNNKCLCGKEPFNHSSECNKNKIESRLTKKDNVATRPWNYYTNDFDGYIKGANGEFVFGGESCEGYIHPEDPNMKFTLMAVNSHEALIEIAKHYSEIMQTEYSDMKEKARVDKIIKQAKGG